MINFMYGQKLYIDLDKNTCELELYVFFILEK